MKQYLILIIFIIACFLSQTEAQNPKLALNNEAKSDSLPPPVMEAKPSYISVQKPEGNFVSQEIKILNRGGSPLVIKKINPSCSCGSSKVLISTIYPMSIGKIILSVNMKGLHDKANTVEFMVESNAKNSPYKVQIAIIDSTDKAVETK